jgi:hypothetical protein
VFSDDMVCAGGCQMAYPVSGRSGENYNDTVPVALKAIRALTGITFTQVR